MLNIVNEELRKEFTLISDTIVVVVDVVDVAVEIVVRL